MQSVFKKLQVVVKQQITRYEKKPQNKKIEFELKKNAFLLYIFYV